MSLPVKPEGGSGLPDQQDRARSPLLPGLEPMATHFVARNASVFLPLPVRLLLIAVDHTGSFVRCHVFFS